MDYRAFHWLEKMQVQLASLAGVVAVYLFAWQYVSPWDVDMPMSFLATGCVHQLSLYALIVLGLVAVMGVVMVSTRPAGVAMAVMFSAGGVALHSVSFRTLLQYRYGDLHTLYHTMMSETAMLWGLALAAVAVMLLMRRLVGFVRPDALWQDPLEGKTPEVSGQRVMNMVFRRYLEFRLMGLGQQDERNAKTISVSQELQRSIICFFMAFVIAILLVLLLLKADARGQCIFAVMASMFIATFVAHASVPCSFFVGAMALPLAAAMVLYWLASNTVMTAGPAAWMEVRPYGMALPIDWMTFGMAASLLGYWMSSCVNENRYLQGLKTHDDEHPGQPGQTTDEHPDILGEPLPPSEVTDQSNGPNFQQKDEDQNV